MWDVLSWLTRLNGPLNEDDVADARDWHTCAVGELFPELVEKMQEKSDLTPREKQIRELGNRFYDHVHDAQYLADRREDAIGVYEDLKEMAKRGD